MGLGCSLCLWAMAYGHSSGLPPQEAPIMMAESIFLLIIILSFIFLMCCILTAESFGGQAGCLMHRDIRDLVSDPL